MEGKTNINKVYDPTCGSGSLLLQMKKQFDEHIIDEGFFGQEINMTNFNLARMNMFLHNVNSVSYTHLTLPTIAAECRSRWSPYH